MTVKSVRAYKRNNSVRPAGLNDRADRSLIFTRYNALRRLSRTFAEQGTPVLDMGRLNRALGIAQRHETTEPQYITTTDRCSCPDFLYHLKCKRPCKHMTALYLTEAVR